MFDFHGHDLWSIVRLGGLAIPRLFALENCSVDRVDRAELLDVLQDIQFEGLQPGFIVQEKGFGLVVLPILWVKKHRLILGGSLTLAYSELRALL